MKPKSLGSDGPARLFLRSPPLLHFLLVLIGCLKLYGVTRLKDGMKMNEMKINYSKIIQSYLCFFLSCLSQLKCVRSLIVKIFQMLVFLTATCSVWSSALRLEPRFFQRAVTVDVQNDTVSLGFQLSGYYGNYHRSPVCFESKQICFGIITGLEDVSDGNDGDHSC